MAHQKLIFFILGIIYSFLIASGGVEGSLSSSHGFRPTKLFVFGDSYADTGNWNKTGAHSTSWKTPYGITYPGHPAGRFSDGLILTDRLAKYFRIKSPAPYERIRKGKHLKHGVNFAYGGTGVFDTSDPYPNMTTQIDYFQNLIHDSIYTQADIANSLVFVSLAGNDYSNYLSKNGLQGMQAFIVQVVNQLNIDLKRIYSLGVRRIVVSGLEPLGCLPTITYVNSFKSCNSTANTLVQYHNSLLQQTVEKLKNETNDSSFVILDLYDSFTSILESSEFANPLTPCCLGTKSGYKCGSVDENGANMYTVCSNRTSAFFWDLFHPTQIGWAQVFSKVKVSLTQFH